MDESSQRRWASDRLVLAAREGNEQAIAALVEVSHPHVRRFATVLCSSRQDAEDAAQEALIVLFRQIGSLRAVGALSSWAFRIVKNECLRLARRPVWREPSESDRVDVSAEARLLRRWESEYLATVIARLPDDQRQVLVMRDVYGRSGHDVARALGLSLSAMKSRLHRAREAVRSSLQGEGLLP